MADQSIFRGVIEFMGELGVYDIILPFLLVFTIVFAILEKTKILGVDKIKDEEITKKNLNSVVAFSISFLVIASTELVRIINEVMANVVLLLILAVSFLLLVGTFFTDKQFSLEDYPGWIKFFMFFMFTGIVVIFLNSFNWLEPIFSIFKYWRAEWASTIIFIVIILGFMWYVVKDEKPKSSDKKEEKKKD